jgi:tetratricopeptide (TPR) repeat protein
METLAGSFHRLTGRPVVRDFSAYRLTMEELHEASRSLRLLKKLPEALEASERALALDPEEDTFWFGKGLVLVEFERFEEALACFRRASELDPEFVNYLSAQGEVLSRLSPRRGDPEPRPGAPPGAPATTPPSSGSATPSSPWADTRRRCPSWTRCWSATPPTRWPGSRRVTRCTRSTGSGRPPAPSIER